MSKYKKPLDDNFLFKILHIHAFSLLYQRLFREITPSDFYDLQQDAQPQRLKQKYVQIKKNMPTEKQFLKSIIISLFKWQLILGCIMSFVVAFLLLQSPLIMKTILEYIEKNQVTQYETNKVTQYIWMWLGVFFIKIFFTEMTDRIFFRIGVKIQLLLTTLFMQKIVKIPNLQGQTKKAEIMNYLTVEIKKVHIFFKKGSWLFSQPPVLILAMFVVFLEGKQYGMLLFQVLFVMVILNMIIDTRMQQCHHHKDQYITKRINTGVQLLKQHRQLKILGWQSMIPEASQFYRKQQNTYNRRYMLLKRIDQSLLVLTTGIFFSIMFVLRYNNVFTSFSTLTLSDLFTITIFIYLLKSPIKNIRYVMKYFNDMLKSLDSIEDFLNKQELQKVNIRSNDCPTGTLLCQNILIKDINDNPDDEEEMMNIKTLVMKKRLSIQEVCYTKQQLVVDIDIKIESGEKVSIYSDSFEGSTFLGMIAGIINKNEGTLLYGGRMTYQNSQVWLMQDSIRSNILIGRPFDKQRLKLVYQVANLQEQLELFLFKERTKINQILHLSQVQKRKIMLARTLYTEADIFLLDDPFKDVPFQTANIILKNIRIYFHEQTFIINTQYPNCPSFDKTIIFDDGRILQFSDINVYMSAKLSSKLSKSQTILDQNSNIQLSMKNAINKQKLLQKKMQSRRQIVLKMKNAVRHLLQILKVVGKDKLGQMIQKNENLQNFAQKRSIFKQNKDTLHNKQKILKILLNSISSRLIFLILIVVASCQTIKLAMNTLFGPLMYETRSSVQRYYIRQYIILTVLLLILEISWGVLQIIISNKISNDISTKMMNAISDTPSNTIQSKNIYDLAEDSNRDYQQIFILTHRSLISFLNIIVLFNIMCLILYLGPYLLLILILLMGFNIIFYRHLLITKRQILRFKHKITNESYSAVAQLVNGISTLRHQADLKYFIFKQMDYVKDYAVFIINQRYSLHAMKMISELSTIIMTFWVMNYAIHNKGQFFGHEIPILFTTIFYCVRLSGLVYLIVQDISEIDILLQSNVIPSIKILEMPVESLESNLSKPEAWPKNNTVEFENVGLNSPESSIQLIKEIAFKIESGRRVALFGSMQSGTQYIIALLSKQLLPSKTIYGEGSIKIGEENIKYIAKKYVRQQVFRLASLPFIMTGTLRMNIDPFNDYRDRDIIRMIDLIGLRKHITCYVDNILQYKITYEVASFQIKQAIDAVRALLRKPAVLISQMVNYPEAQIILSTYLPYTTIIFVNPMIKSLEKCNCTQLLFIWKGVLAENGYPDDILDNRNSVFVKKYLPIYQDKIRQHVESIRTREKSMSKAKQQMNLP